MRSELALITVSALSAALILVLSACCSPQVSAERYYLYDLPQGTGYKIVATDAGCMHPTWDSGLSQCQQAFTRKARETCKLRGFASFTVRSTEHTEVTHWQVPGVNVPNTPPNEWTYFPPGGGSPFLVSTWSGIVICTEPIK